MATKFVQRDEGGQIKGVYARKQEGHAEEEIDEAHQDLVAFRDRIKAPSEAAGKTLVDQIIADPAELAKLKKALDALK